MKYIFPEQPTFIDITLLGNHNEVLVEKEIFRSPVTLVSNQKIHYGICFHVYLIINKSLKYNQNDIDFQNQWDVQAILIESGEQYTLINFKLWIMAVLENRNNAWCGWFITVPDEADFVARWHLSELYLDLAFSFSQIITVCSWFCANNHLYTSGYVQLSPLVPLR